MEIQPTRPHGLFPTPPEGQQTSQPGIGLPSTQPASSPVESTRDSTETPGLTTGLAQALQTGGGSSFLSAGEKQALGLLFDNQGEDQEGAGFRLYGVRQPQKAGIIGNFLDVRG